MQVQVVVIANGELVFLRFAGQQTVRKALTGLQEMQALPGYRPGMPELADLSAITENDLDFHAMRRLAHESCTVGVTPERRKRIALYAPQDSVYGMARMFSTLVELASGNAEAAAFRTEQEALSWLNRPEKRMVDIPGYDFAIAE